MYYDVVVERRNWYKIKTSNEIEGWICGNVNENTYIRLFPPVGILISLFNNGILLVDNVYFPGPNKSKDSNCKISRN